MLGSRSLCKPLSKVTRCRWWWCAAAAIQASGMALPVRPRYAHRFHVQLEAVGVFGLAAEFQQVLDMVSSSESEVMRTWVLS